ncbi:MAG: right-handed parallel beta-helix repeat-containing protein [Xanthomonadales bacterium]|nr:right-handed parallel beta-helix repeat-containing protein [Xanthomonadales bacterium]
MATTAPPQAQGSVENQGETLEAYASITQRPGSVYVDDGFAGSMPGAPKSFVHPQVNGGAAIPVVFGQDAFATIADALAQVQVGGTVYVAKGRYAEDFLAISRPVSIVGEQAGVDARTRSTVDADETIIVPGIAQPGLTLSSYEIPVIDIYSSDVALDGVIIDADNPALTSGLAYNGADPDVATGIFVQGNNTRFENSIFRNILYSGIDGYHVGNSASGGNIIRHNRFANITSPSAWGVAVILQDNFYAQVNDNLFNEVRVGVQTNNNHRVAPNGFLPSISGNEIHATRIGVFHNLFYSSASSYSINGNDFIAVANAGEAGQWMGLWIESMGAAQTVTINGNTVDGLAVAGSRPSVGYLLNNITSTASASTVINGGSASNIGVGVLATDATRYTGPVNDFVVRNIAFSDIGIAAFYVEDTTEQAGSAKLSIGDGNTYTSVAHVLALSGSAPAAGFVDSQNDVASVFVRSARGYYYRPAAAPYNVSNAAINPAIGYVQVGGTVSVEAGSFNESVNVNKSVSVKGAFAGTTGFDPLRGGSGETVIAPVSGSAFTLAASNAAVDGFTLTVANGVAVGPGGASRDNMQFINNRIVDIADGVGIRFEPGEGTPASGLTITGNLFANINGSGVNGSAIQLYKGTRNAVVSNNHIDSARTYAIQVNGGNGSVLNTTITGNVISDSLALGTYDAFLATNVDGMQLRDNTVTDVLTGLYFSDKVSNLDVLCNSIDAVTRGISTSNIFGNVPEHRHSYLRQCGSRRRHRRHQQRTDPAIGGRLELVRRYPGIGDGQQRLRR